MKNKLIIAVITLGILMFCFIPPVTGNKGRITFRSIDDWLWANWNDFPWGVKNADGTQDWVFYDVSGPNSLLACKMGIPIYSADERCTWFRSAYDMVDETSLVEGDTIITGTILEHELNDGTALITLSLDVKNAPLTVYNVIEYAYYCFELPGYQEPPEAILGAGIDGYIDYRVECKFIIPFPGAELPNIMELLFSDFSLTYNYFGTGFGTLTSHAADFGFTPGKTGMVKFHDIMIQNSGHSFDIDHPQFYNGIYPAWAVEIHEMN